MDVKKICILLVEGDELFGDCLLCGLTHYNYDVVWAKDSLIAWNSLQEEHFDLVILDLDLPNFSGEKVLKKMRSENIATPVIVLSNYDNVHARVKGFSIGADGYLGRPFELEELCARIRAIYRRTVSCVKPIITIGNIILDTAARQVFKSGKEIKPSRYDFMLLQVLMEKAGQVVLREQLLRRLYGWSCTIDSNALDVHIYNLRKSLGYNAIITSRGQGYMFAREVSGVVEKKD